MTGPGIARVEASAKLNLTLAVLGGPVDGYHPLRGVFARLALADELVLDAVGAPGGADHLRIRYGQRAGPDSIADEGDLVLRAMAALRSWAGRPLAGLDLSLRKRIPAAAGLGGGSSDGAAALRLAAGAWRLRVPPAELAAIAIGLGADVPFFLGRSSLALVGGRGEQITPLSWRRAAGAGVLLICRPGKPSTGQVFAAHDALPSGAAQALEVTDAIVRALRARRPAPAPATMAALLRDANDLFEAAASLMPWLPGWRRTIEGVLGRPAMLSGAGPTLAVLYPSLAEAQRARRALGAALGAEGSHVGTRIIATTIAGGSKGNA